MCGERLNEQRFRRECLDRFVFFGETHLQHVLGEFVTWYHRKRPHQALGNAPPGAPPAAPEGPTPGPGDVVCDERLGGLLKHYARRAA